MSLCLARLAMSQGPADFCRRAPACTIAGVCHRLLPGLRQVMASPSVGGVVFFFMFSVAFLFHFDLSLGPRFHPRAVYFCHARHCLMVVSRNIKNARQSRSRFRACLLIARQLLGTSASHARLSRSSFLACFLFKQLRAFRQARS